MADTNPTQTLVIDNFAGRLTGYSDGDINSGFAYNLNTFGNNPLNTAEYGNLTWSEMGVQIDAAGSVVTDMIMAGKVRVESGILYVYAIGHTGRLYKIQVNDPTTFNPDYDNPVLLATLSINSPTFTRGGSIDFYGATQKIYIGHDKGVTSINFNGTGEAFVGVLGSWTQTVPRPLKQFIGVLYIGNGSNIAAIDTTATVTSYAKLSPSFPTNSQVRDIDVSPDGTYLQAVVSQIALPDITSSAQDTTSTASSESYIFKWNGTDAGYTSFATFPSFSLSANIMFQNYQYTFGTDQYGMAVYNPNDKIITSSDEIAPLPNAVNSTGNIVTWMAPLYYIDHLELTCGFWGPMDYELGTGYWAPFGQVATDAETDIIQVPFQLPVSNFGLGSSSNGYPDNVFSTAKVYFSTLETSAGPTTKYRLYKWSPIPTTNGTAISGIYQTQKQIFSKKIQIKEVRIYGAPWVANNEFTIDMVGSDGAPIPGGSKTFTAGSNLTIGNDFAWYTPQAAPTFCVGLRVTNSGTANHVISKVEIDFSSGGK